MTQDQGVDRWVGLKVSLREHGHAELTDEAEDFGEGETARQSFLAFSPPRRYYFETSRRSASVFTSAMREYMEQKFSRSAGKLIWNLLESAKRYRG